MTAIFDLHDQAYHVWRDAGVSQAVLVHVDAHHDAARHPVWEPMDIGNYVRAAIRAGMLSEVHWVVPDPMWLHQDTRRVLVRELADIADHRPVEDTEGVRASVEGLDLWMGLLTALQLPAGVVVLDIDVDYLLTARYEQHRTAEPLPLPWCRPDDLLVRLRGAGVGPVLTTIASSVTGGFTQLRWAHLAREIAARLEGESASAFLTCCRLLWDAAALREGGDVPRALDMCRAAVAVCPAEAAAHFHLAELLQQSGQLPEGRAAYARARALDGFYAHPFRTRGPYLFRRRRFREAEAAYREALALAPDDSHAQLGLAMVLVRRGRVEEARGLSERSLAIDAGAVDAWRTLGEARARSGNAEGAIAAYEHAILLSLRGASPVRGPWCTNAERRLVDPRHWRDHAALGDLYARLGDMEAGIAHYRIAVSGAPASRALARGLAALQARSRLGCASGGVLPS